MISCVIKPMVSRNTLPFKPLKQNLQRKLSIRLVTLIPLTQRLSWLSYEAEQDWLKGLARQILQKSSLTGPWGSEYLTMVQWIKDIKSSRNKLLALRKHSGNFNKAEGKKFEVKVDGENIVVKTGQVAVFTVILLMLLE